MINPRYRPVWIALAILAGAWLLAWGGFRIAGSFRMTAEKYATFTRNLDLEKLTGERRAKALQELADNLNRLSAEERRRIRLSQSRDRLFNQMTEEEKAKFIEATMPTGFKQMITSFEQLPEDKRKKAIEGAIKRMKDRHDPDFISGDGASRPPLSEDLQKRIVGVGLSTFYKESSAQTKAEVAPLLEELQRTMESGRLFR